MIAQVQPEVGRDLVVAAAAGPELAAERAEPLEQPPLERGVHVLVGDRRPERPSSTARSRSSSAPSMSRPGCRTAVRPGAASARAPGTPKGRSGRAASRTGRSATAAQRSAGPPSDRPPHNRVGVPPDACSPDPICPTHLASNKYRPRVPTLIEVRVAGGAVFRGMERTVAPPQRPSLIVFPGQAQALVAVIPASHAVGYAIDRFQVLSATPSTAPIRVDGVGDRSRSGRWRR